MRWTGRRGGSGEGAHDDHGLIGVAIDFPDRGRPRRSDVGDHLAPYFGPADRVIRARRGGPLKVDVNIVWPAAGRPWTTAYTVGASSRPMTVPQEVRSRFSPYAELFLRLPADWVPERVCAFCVPRRAERDPFADARTTEPFEWLALLARLPHVQKSFLGQGHIVELRSEAPHDDVLPFPGFYLDAGWDEAADRAIPPLVRSGGRRVDFLGVIPLYAAELRAMRAGRGQEVLSSLDAARVTELFDPGRPCCVPGGA